MDKWDIIRSCGAQVFREEILPKSFSKKYNLTKLIYHEEVGSLEDAFYRERQLKSWRKQWKVNLVNKFNYLWDDLCDSITYT